MDYLLLIVGFAVLIKASDFLVDGASSLARRAGMSDYLVGLTVVAFATSMPELVVNLLAIKDGIDGIALGNVVGSNTLNIFVVVGMPAMIVPMVFKNKKLLREVFQTLLLSGLLLYVACDSMFREGAVNVVSRWEGIVMLTIFTVWIVYTIRTSKADEAEVEKMVRMSATRTAIYLLIGVIGLFIGGKLIVSSASSIAAALGMSQTAIGLTVVALGTSLPEIVTSIIAARKISGEMAVGNVLGSNIFNGLFILGISASIMPVSVGETFSQLDLYITMVGSVLLMICIGLWKKISRVWGTIFVLLYALYVMYALGIIKL